MGSLVFLGQDLEGTPYADLSIKPTSNSSPTSHPIDLDQGLHLPLLPLVSLCESGDEDCQVNEASPNAFVRAAHLFGTVACSQLNLSSIDPLRTAFASGLRVLPKLHKLQRAFAWLTNYTPGNSDGTHTLPVSIVSLSCVFARGYY